MHGGDIYRNHVTLDFSVNINPLGIPDSVKKAMLEAVEQCTCYPDIRCAGLIKAIGSMTGALEDQILCGSGASELFLAIIHGLKPKKIVIPVPSFYGYEKAALACHADIVWYEMKKENGFCLDNTFLEHIPEDTDLLFLANPNNPVGNLLKPNFLEQLIRTCMKKKITVVLDECFIEFTETGTQDSFLLRAEEFPNLIVVRAFTKIFAIPGVRLGYLVCGNKKWHQDIARQLPEWNLSVFAQMAGAAAAREMNYLERTIRHVKTDRKYLSEELKKMGISVFPSTANYMMFYTEHLLFDQLLKKGILIRDCSNFRGLSNGYYRIAVKNRRENTELIQAIGQIIQKESRKCDGKDLIL